LEKAKPTRQSTRKERRLWVDCFTTVLPGFAMKGRGSDPNVASPVPDFGPECVENAHLATQ
jgi:hypothetical protein